MKCLATINGQVVEGTIYDVTVDGNTTWVETSEDMYKVNSEDVQVVTEMERAYTNLELKKEIKGYKVTESLKINMMCIDEEIDIAIDLLDEDQEIIKTYYLNGNSIKDHSMNRENMMSEAKKVYDYLVKHFNIDSEITVVEC